MSVLASMSQRDIEIVIDLLDEYMARWMSEPAYDDKDNVQHDRQVAKVEALSDVSSDLAIILSEMY